MSDNLNTIGIRGKIAARTPDYRYTLPEGGNPGDIPVKTEDGVEWQQPEPAATTPDWSQNDETASDYIRNRPGGYDVPLVLDLWCDGWWYIGVPDEHSLVFDASGEEDLTPGRAVSVTIGGVAHQTELRLFDADNLKFYVGNMALSEKFNGPGGDDTGETFCVCFSLDKADDGTYYISSSGIDANITDIGENDTTLSTPLILTPEHKMIPQEYLDSVGRVYTVKGEVGGEIFNWKPGYGPYGMPIASGNYSHAEGAGTTASGHCSHAEGSYTTASGYYSHAEGSRTTASGYSSHVQGQFNIEDTADKYAHIVGNGTNDIKRSNAHTLDWSGNAWYAGTVEGAAMIVKSSTSGSAKRYKLSIGDDGKPVVTDLSDSSTAWSPDSIASLPTVTTSDSGKFLRVSASGAWAAEAISNAEEASF